MTNGTTVYIFSYELDIDTDLMLNVENYDEQFKATYDSIMENRPTATENIVDYLLHSLHLAGYNVALTETSSERTA